MKLTVLRKAGIIFIIVCPSYMKCCGLTLLVIFKTLNLKETIYDQGHQVTLKFLIAFSPLIMPLITIGENPFFNDIKTICYLLETLKYNSHKQKDIIL